MNHTDIENTLLEVAAELCEEGPGSAQESVVLRETAKRLSVSRDVKTHQVILDCWQNLFRQGKLNWGHDLDNPSAPFFHLTTIQAVRN